MTAEDLTKLLEEGNGLVVALRACMNYLDRERSKRASDLRSAGTTAIAKWNVARLAAVGGAPLVKFSFDPMDCPACAVNATEPCAFHQGVAYGTKLIAEGQL